MTARRSILIATTVTLLAFVLGFALRRSTTKQPAGEPDPVNQKTTASTEARSDPAALPQELPNDPDALFELAVERYQANDAIASAIAFYRWLEVADAATIDAAIMAGDESTLDEVHWNTATLRWAELDPDSFIKKVGDNEFTHHVILLTDLRADAMAALDSCPPESAEFCREYIAARHPDFDLDWARSFGVPLEWFVGIWLRRDLDSASLFADIGDLEPEVAKAILHDVIGDRDPDRIAAILEELGDDPESLKMVHQAIGEMLGDGVAKPLESLKILERFGIEYPSKVSGGPHVVPIYHYHEIAMSETPEAMIEWLLGLDPEARKSPLGTLFNNNRSGMWNENGRLDLYARLPREELPSVHDFSMAVKSVIGQDPNASLEWFEKVKTANQFSIGNEHNHREFLTLAGQLGSRFALGGTESAIETARKIEDAELRDAVLAGVVEHAGLLDPESARTVLAEIGDDFSATARAAAEQKILQQDIQSDFRNSPFDAALERLNTIEDEKIRTEIARSVTRDYEMSFADRATLLEQFPNFDVIKYPASFSQDWAKKDPEAAADWVMQLADHEAFPKHIEALIGTWAEQDVNAAGTWLQQVESEPALDAAKAKVATRVSSVEPHTALEWAASISDPEKRAKSLRQAIISIDTFASETGEANDAIANLAISEEERAMLQAHLAE